MLITQKLDIRYSSGKDFDPNAIKIINGNEYTIKELLFDEELLNEIDKDIVLKYNLPSDNVIKVYSENRVLNDDDFEVRGTVIRFLKPSSLEKNLYVDMDSEKDKFVSYKDDGVFKTLNESETLKPNSVFEIELQIKDEKFDLSFTTNYSPLYCNKSDVKRLISPVIDYMSLSDDELLESIFNQSNEIKEEFLKEKDEDFLKEKGGVIKKLTSNRTALDLMYNYYYKLTGEYGLEEKRTGTISEQVQRNLAKLDDLIRRFMRNIDALEAQLKEIKTTKPFVKANKFPYPIKGRMWESKK